MDRRSRHRIGKCEELLSAALKERDERLKQVLQVAPTYARCHAAAVGAIVLLLQFTGMALDARLLRFDLPEELSRSMLK